MNKAVELVTEWGVFDDKYPDGSIEDFCRHYLIREREKSSEGRSFGGILPPGVSSQLMKLMGRIFKLHSIYAAAAVEGTGLNSVDEFSLFITIQQLNEPRKTEAIYACLHELSTGTDMINRLRKLGYITEYEDTEDRRSKRLRITPKGEKVLAAARERVIALAEMMLHDLSEDDKRLCYQLLKPVEITFSGLWQGHKGKEFDDVYEEVMGARRVQSGKKTAAGKSSSR